MGEHKSTALLWHRSFNTQKHLHHLCYLNIGKNYCASTTPRLIILNKKKCRHRHLTTSVISICEKTPEISRDLYIFKTFLNDLFKLKTEYKLSTEIQQKTQTKFQIHEQLSRIKL